MDSYSKCKVFWLNFKCCIMKVSLETLARSERSVGFRFLTKSLSQDGQIVYFITFYCKKYLLFCSFTCMCTFMSLCKYTFKEKLCFFSCFRYFLFAFHLISSSSFVTAISSVCDWRRLIYFITSAWLQITFQAAMGDFSRFSLGNDLTNCLTHLKVYCFVMNKASIWEVA